MDKSEFEVLLRETIGLDASSIGEKAVARAVRARMDHGGFGSFEDYWQQIQNDGDELQELVETLIVPETSFFREPEAFRALARFVSEEWIPTHPGETLHILSAPCASGEEPFSIVMALLDAGFPCRRLRVDAVDISLRALARAREATYGLNSFRGQDLAFRDRYFAMTPKGYVVSPVVRGSVEFHHGNLLSSEFQFGALSHDVIFCRNLLIYLERGKQEFLMESLCRVLSSDGLLFVGPAEAFLATAHGFKAANLSLAFAFRKRRSLPVVTHALPLPILGRKPKHTANLPQRVPSLAKSPAPLAPVQSTPPETGIALARKLADAGKLVEAAAACQAHIGKHGGTAEDYCLLGLIHDAAGDENLATECYRKALYLAPDHNDALIHLALLSERLGDVQGARRLRERASAGAGGSQE